MATEAGDSAFVSILDEYSRKKAKDELNEHNEKDREIAVQTLRKWVIETKWLTSPTDFGFLLRFLRTRKFSQLGARQMIENYWALKTNVPDYYRNLDPADPIVQAIIKSGFCYSPKKLDKKNRRVFLVKFGSLDTETLKACGTEYAFKALSLVFEWMACDENVQVNGLVVLADHTDLSMNTVLHLITPKTSKIMMKYCQKALPIRTKGINDYNEPVFFDAVLAVMRPFMTEKVKSRQVLHGRSLVKIYEDMGQEVLPREYLPDDYCGQCVGTTKEVIDEMLTSMNRPEFKKYIQELTSDKYGIDLDKRKQDTTSEEASFRKLAE